MFSVIIPSFNNLDYLKLCIRSLKKNSEFNNEIIVHLNEGNDGSLEFIKNSSIKFTHTEKNVGLCTATNLAANESSSNYLLYSHDDMYFCPKWDKVLRDEIKNYKNNAYYISGTMIEKNSGHIQLDCGDKYNNFDEKKLLNNFDKIKFFDHQGTHWAPHLIHKEYWNKIGGFSEEFNPGIGSDPDLNMKLWNSGVRIFKGLNAFRVYHFGSIVLRKKKNLKRNSGSKTFLLKWGITPIFFTKYYLRGGSFKNNVIKCYPFDGPLKQPRVNLSYIISFIVCKLKLIYLKIIKF